VDVMKDGSVVAAMLIGYRLPLGRRRSFQGLTTEDIARTIYQVTPVKDYGNPFNAARHI
jgi:hypothetical protein